MINVKTKVSVADNSGAVYAECIKILGSHKNYAPIGKKVVVAIKKIRIRKKGKLKKKEICKGIVVRSSVRTKRRTGLLYAFSTNAIVLVDQRNNPIGHRVKGLVPQELRLKKHMRIVSLANGVF